MGTEFEDKAYIPGYFDIADSSVYSNGMLPYYEEKKPTLHHIDKFTIFSTNGSVHYDKEMLKRTMLVHEATFRKQVYELHRLYQIQNDLMAQFKGEEFNDYPRYADTLKSRTYASPAPPEDVKGVRQTGTPNSGHDLKHSSIDFINETSSQYSVNGASLRCSNFRSRNKMLDLQLPADVYADDVEILDEDPLKYLPGTVGSVHNGNNRINLGNCASKHVKNWTTDTQPQHNLAVHILNKPVEEPSNTKITDFSVGIATQKQHNLSEGVNLNLLDFQGNSREKHAVEASGSSFFGSKETTHINSFRQRKDDPNTSIAWLQHKQNGTNSSFGQYMSSNSSFNHLILAPPLFNDALNSPWQINNTSHYGISMGSTNTPYHHRHKTHRKLQDWKPLPCQNIVKDLDLNDVPADTAATWQEGSESSLVDTSAFSEKPMNWMKSQVPPSCANGLSQTFVSSTLDSDIGTLTRIPSFPISAAAEKDSRRSPALECDINIAVSIKRDYKEMQPQSKNADSSFRNFFDLNEALPAMDDIEVDACEQEGGIAPHKPNDPSRDSLAIIAAENLVAMVIDGIQPGSPQLDTLLWFADLATSKEKNDSDDDFEALTLKLEETKSYEFLSAPRTQEGDSNDGHCSAASLLATRPRRGKARGRPPKKKDFQKDILPCLVSLPEKEVWEDLRLLGRAKPLTPAKRRGRNGQQTRGRRRPRSVAAVVVVEEMEVNPPSPPLVPADLDADAPRITRWGRTTRRCRRPRCPPVNNASEALFGDGLARILSSY